MPTTGLFYLVMKKHSDFNKLRLRTQERSFDQYITSSDQTVQLELTEIFQAIEFVKYITFNVFPDAIILIVSWRGLHKKIVCTS